MEQYFIYAYEARYGGYYGIYSYELIYCVDEDEANDIGRDLSRDVIESYINPEDEYYSREDYVEMSGLDSWDDSYEQDYYEALDEEIESYIEYEVYLMKQPMSDEDFSQWEEEDGDPRDFIRQYCA